VSRLRVKQIRGLPDELPAGERLLWQGAPNWRALCVRAFHVRKVAAYFALLVLWRVTTGVADGADLATIATACSSLVALAVAAIGILVLLAWLSARTTIYSITSQRVVFRCGIALSMDLNIPYRTVGAAELNPHADGTGDIALALPKGTRIAYLNLWPHARPWHFRAPQPTLRCVPEASRVADLLSRSLAAATGGQARGVTEPAGPGVAAPTPPRASVAA
jgi:hypothetical protein